MFEVGLKFFHLILLLDHNSLKITKNPKENIKDKIKGIIEININMALTLTLLSKTSQPK